jgi:ribosome-associated toxin RatA of RatAB toxin-antitoxin module
MNIKHLVLILVACMIAATLSCASLGTTTTSQDELNMAKYDVTDEAIINASPEVVYNAIINEYDGKTSWWLPYFSSKIREGGSSGTVGGLFDITIHGICPIKFTAKTLETKKNEMLRLDYVQGSFRGIGVWKFENLDGKTKISFRWRMSPAGWLRIVAPFYPIVKSHSDVMQKGFIKLNKFLE